MDIRVLLTVQPRQGRMRFFRADVTAERVPAVGDDVAVARYENTTPGSSLIQAKVTAVLWSDLSFVNAVVFLRTDDEAVEMHTLVDPDQWVDEGVT